MSVLSTDISITEKLQLFVTAVIVSVFAEMFVFPVTPWIMRKSRENSHNEIITALGEKFPVSDCNGSKIRNNYAGGEGNFPLLLSI